MGKTVTYDLVELNIDGHRYRITLTPVSDEFTSVTVQRWNTHGDCWLYVGPKQWEHRTGTYTYPDDRRSGNE